MSEDDIWAGCMLEADIELDIWDDCILEDDIWDDCILEDDIELDIWDDCKLEAPLDWNEDD